MLLRKLVYAIIMILSIADVYDMLNKTHRFLNELVVWFMV